MLTKLYLENYIPLLSSGINKVEMDLQHMVNLFIAQNGVGKTSIMMEANPMPPENGNYKNGRKLWEWKEPGKHYILDSRTHQGDGHTFVLNGENLNKGGTYSEQKELVWHHFKLDQNRCRVLSGVKLMDLFSNMPIARRKDIFMWLYPNDTQYAMGVYNKLKTERNELKAVIKNQVARYTDENAKLQQIAACGVEELESRIKAIDEELRQSLLVRGSLESVRLDPALQAKLHRFNALTEQLTVNKVSGFFDTEQELVEAIEINEHLYSTSKEQGSVLAQVIAEHSSVLEGMDEFLEDPLVFQHQSDQIKADLTKMQEEIKQHDTILEQYPLFNSDTISLDGLDRVQEAFGAQLRKVVNASMPDLNGSQYKQLTTLHDTTVNKLREVEGKLSGVAHQLKHFDSLAPVECPECDHEFKVGVSPAEIQKLRDSKEALGIQLGKLEQEKRQLKDQIDNDAEWYESMMALHQFCQFNREVPALTMLVKEYNIGKGDTNILLNALRTYAGRVDLVKRCKLLMEEQDLLNTRIGLMQRNNVLDIAVYVQSLEEDLAKENRRTKFYQNKLQDLNRKLVMLRNYNNDLQQLRVLKEEILKGLENEGLLHLRERVDNRISLLTEEKDDYLTSIIKSRSLNAVVESISEDINRMKRRLSIVETLMDGLCPNKGLIGRMMTDFIKTFCGNMNAIIQAVWNTPLYVKPCNKDNGDLTYKFPVVNGDADPAPDVSNCSLGQTGIIDFAFRCVALSYHGNGPLIMDEVGTTFDEIKRGRFFNFVKELTQKKDARQLLLVSHYINQIGIFSNPNIVAMKHDGLSMPGEPNKHSVIS